MKDPLRQKRRNETSPQKKSHPDADHPLLSDVQHHHGDEPGHLDDGPDHQGVDHGAPGGALRHHTNGNAAGPLADPPPDAGPRRGERRGGGVKKEDLGVEIDDQRVALNDLRVKKRKKKRKANLLKNRKSNLRRGSLAVNLLALQVQTHLLAAK